MKDFFIGGAFAVGLYVGIACSVLSFLILNREFITSLDKGIQGAVFGGFAAGVATILAVILSNAFDRYEKSKLRNLQRQERFMLVYTRIFSHHDLVVKVYRHFFSSLPEDLLSISADKGGQQTPFLTLVKPMFGLVKTADFALEDEAFCYANKKGELGHFLGNLRRAETSIVSLHDKYLALFEAISDAGISDPRTRVSNASVQSISNNTQAEFMRIKDIESLLRDFAQKQSQEVLRALQCAQEILEKDFGFKVSVKDQLEVQSVIRSSYSEGLGAEMKPHS